MKTRYLTVIAISLVSFACDKVRNLTDKAKSTVASEVAKKSGGSAGSKPDPELQKLVDQTPEGTVFRKDLPFPKQIEVKVTRRGRFPAGSPKNPNSEAR